MATHKWKCDACGHIGPTEKFKDGESHRCPKCGNEDCVFPHRIFKCLKCKYTAEQPIFFASDERQHVESDPDPVIEQWKYTCTNEVGVNPRTGRPIPCGSTDWTQIH